MPRKPQKKRKKAAEGTSGPPEAGVFVMSDLEQVRILADPLRLRILEELCSGERTTKQVADLLGEKPGKLYHHVEALERVGLIGLTRTRQNRGTLEKYYRAVARSFRAEPEMFGGAGATKDDLEAANSVLSSLLDTTARELRALIKRGSKELEEKGIVGFVEIRGAAEELDAIRERVDDLVGSLAKWTSEKDDDEDATDVDALQRYRLMLAFYPLPDRSD